MTTKFLENKLCKTCNKELHYNKFRKIKVLAKRPNKGKFPGWAQIAKVESNLQHVQSVKMFNISNLKREIVAND